MEHEDNYALMMEALDGELNESGRTALQAHLRACPLCAREWQALTAIDRLFRQAPALSPAADFTQRTLSRLPNKHYRVWLISAIYLLLLVSGVIPLVAIGWLGRQLAPVLSEPALVRSLAQAAAHMMQIVRTVAGALWQGVDQLSGILIQQPSLLGSLLVMAGIVALWSGIYNQLVSPRGVGRGA